jgi:hypothetical protein
MLDLFYLSDGLLTSSYTWKSIVKAISFFKDGFTYRVGYEDISLWYDCWLEGGPLASCVPFVNIMDVDKQVEDIYGKITLGTLEIWQRQLIPLDLQYKIRVVPISWVFIMA